MKRKAYDVIVVGCGPAGAVAGMHIASAGLSTLIVDRRRDIGLPLHHAGQLFYSISSAEETAKIRIDRRCIITKVEQEQYFTSSGDASEALPFEDACIVDGQLFDKSLATQAARKGAEIMINAPVVNVIREDNMIRGVIVKKQGEMIPVHSQVVIGADGIDGIVGRLCGLHLETPNCTIGAEYTLVNVKPIEPPTFELCWIPGFGAGGFGYVMPRIEDSIYVGMQIPQTLQGKLSIEQSLGKFMKHLQDSGRYHLEGAQAVRLCTGSAVVGVQPQIESLITDGALLVGDAARRPTVGSRWGSAGIAHAMFTGCLAAETVVDAIKHHEVSKKRLAAYVDKIQETVDEQETNILEAGQMYRRLTSLGNVERDRAIKEVGQDIARLRLLARGALPFKASLEVIKKWLEGVSRKDDHDNN